MIYKNIVNICCAFVGLENKRTNRKVEMGYPLTYYMFLISHFSLKDSVLAGPGGSVV
jgi:hypothetical protein